MSQFLSLNLMHRRGVEAGWGGEERRPFKAMILGSSPSRLTTSSKRQNLQNDLQPRSACLVVLRIVFKNLSPTQDPKCRFF
jgi:hypothetical protein